MTGKESDNPLASIYETGGEAALEAEYDKWSASYDADTAGSGYRLPFLLTGFVARHIPSTEAEILDAGAGTGFGGESLAVLGYRNLTGIDLSREMLDQAAKTEAYRDLMQMKLGGALAFDDQRFDGVISTGVFTEGHAPASSFDELLRITRPGGHMIFSVRDDIYWEQGFKEMQDSLADSGKWKLIEQTKAVRAYTIGEPHLRVIFFVYRVS